MNILYLSQRVPYPPHRGDKIASYHAIRHLAQRHSVFVAALADSPEEMEHAKKLEAMGFAVDVALLRPLESRRNALGALLGREPLSVAYYRSAELAGRIVERARTVHFDVVVAFSSSMGQYARLLPEVPLIADFVDMDSRKWELYAQARGWPRSMLYALEERRLLAHERELSTRAACTLLRTRAEVEDCRRLIPGPRFEVLSNGVDLEVFRAEGPKPASQGIVFTGVMDYFPNVQGAMYFCREILPRIRRAVPDASLTIVGSRPTRQVIALGRLPGVTVTGQVPDVRPYVQQAAVAVAPLLLARGIQNKILEAMAMRTPVVATPAAFRGVDATEGEGVIPAATATEFSDRVIELLRDPVLAARVGAAGRRLVEGRYVWSNQLARLETILEEAASLEPTTARGLCAV